MKTAAITSVLIGVLIYITLQFILFPWIEEKLIYTAERAYFEGQKDAINGDIRIKMNSDSVYMWVKYPWNDSNDIKYIPTYADSKP